VNENFSKFATLNKLKKENMKKLTILALISFFLVSASSLFAQDNMKSRQVSATSNSQVVVVTPEKFQDYAAENVGKEVEIKGMVVHVCKEGGKKLFIVGQDPEMRVKITTSDKVSVFEPELEGSTIVVQGIIEPIAEEQVPEQEKSTQDADHTNYYHKPQFSISCMKFSTLED
jgi:hypothetical protein